MCKNLQSIKHVSCKNDQQSSRDLCSIIGYNGHLPWIDYCSRRLNATADVMAKICRKDDGTLNVTRSFPTLPSYCMDVYRNDCKTIFNMVM